MNENQDHQRWRMCAICARRGHHASQCFEDSFYLKESINEHIFVIVTDLSEYKDYDLPRPWGMKRDFIFPLSLIVFPTPDCMLVLNLKNESYLSFHMLCFLYNAMDRRRMERYDESPSWLQEEYEKFFFVLDEVEIAWRCQREVRFTASPAQMKMVRCCVIS